MVIIKLYNLLESRGWTQRHLHYKTGIRESTISDMCNNNSKMLGVESLNQICKALNCKIEDIIEYMPEEESD